MPPADPLHPAAHQPRIVVADADGGGRARRVAALRDAGFVVAAQTAQGREAVELARYYEPELLLLCADLDGADPVMTTHAALDACAGVGVAVLTRSDDLALGQAAVGAGARAVVPEDAALPVLHAALWAVAAGMCSLSPELARAAAVVPGSGYRPIHGPLSNREWQILDGLLAGRTADELRSALVITDETMRSHLKHIRSKLGARTHEDVIAAGKALFFSRPPVSPPRS